MARRQCRCGQLAGFARSGSAHRGNSETAERGPREMVAQDWRNLRRGNCSGCCQTSSQTRAEICRREESNKTETEPGKEEVSAKPHTRTTEVDAREAERHYAQPKPRRGEAVGGGSE